MAPVAHRRRNQNSESMNISELNEQKLPDLRDMAKKMGLAGFSTMKKQDLIYKILEANAEKAADGRKRDAESRDWSRSDNGSEKSQKSAPSESQKNEKENRGDGEQ